MPTSSTCNNISPAVMVRSRRSISCLKTRTISSAPAAKITHPAVPRISCEIRDAKRKGMSGKRCGNLGESVGVIVPVPWMANRKDSTDRTFRLVHVHNVRRRHRHDVGDALINRRTNPCRQDTKSSRKHSKARADLATPSRI